MAHGLGLLDFQDALAGHPAYDLVSLLQDARRDVSPAVEKAMLARYMAAATVSADFEAAYAVLGAQRNAKIIGIFTRLWKRDGKPRYLAYLPRMWGLLERDLAHPALAPVAEWFAANVPAERARRIAGDMSTVIETAMLMAAGLGKRMRPLTATRPKPLVRVAGQALIDHALDRIEEAGIRRTIVNVHYLPDAIEAHLKSRAKRTGADYLISDERALLLETGGGLVKATAVAR